MKKITQKVSGYFFRLFPEGRPRMTLRRAILLVRPHLPREIQLSRGDVVVQVGTPNITTLERCVNCVGLKGKMIVIEADKASARRLKGWVKENTLCDQITIVNMAAWSEKASIKLLKATRPGDNRLENNSIVTDNDLREGKENGGYKEYELMDTDKLDSILESVLVDSIDYMEITINGAELEALKGAVCTLKNTKRLYVKGHSRDADSSVPIVFEIQELLVQAGFKTMATIPSTSVAKEWGVREGDIFAYR